MQQVKNANIGALTRDTHKAPLNVSLVFFEDSIDQFNKHLTSKNDKHELTKENNELTTITNKRASPAFSSPNG
jgi:hypothetical protein